MRIRMTWAEFEPAPGGVRTRRVTRYEPWLNAVEFKFTHSQICKCSRRAESGLTTQKLCVVSTNYTRTSIRLFTIMPGPGYQSLKSQFTPFPHPSPPNKRVRNETPHPPWS